MASIYRSRHLDRLHSPIVPAYQLTEPAVAAFVLIPLVLLAILVWGIATVWRRAGAELSIDVWRRLSKAEREAVEAEASSLPLPGLNGPITVRWSGFVK